MDESGVEKLWVGPMGELLMMRSFCDLPTASFENIETGEKICGTVGSPNLKGINPATELFSGATVSLLERLMREVLRLRQERDEWHDKYTKLVDK